MSSIPQTVTTDKYVMSLREGNFLCLRFADRKVIGVNDAKEINGKALEMVQGQHFLLLVDSSDSLVSVTAAARECFAADKEVNKLRVAQAFVVDNTPNRILARFYAYFNYQASPVEIFEKEKEARNWLLKQWKERFATNW